MPDKVDEKNSVSLLVLLAVCLGVSAIGGAVTQSSVNDWYQTLIKPAFTPPDWVFAPAWVTLYVMMAFAAWRIWIRPSKQEHLVPLAIFATQLILNLIWSFIFFGATSPGLAAIEIVVLWIAILANLILFWRVDHFAGWLLCPYLLWVTFACYLNISIYLLN